VLVDEAASFKKSAGLRFMEPLLGNGLLSAEFDVHKRHRKLLAPAFAPGKAGGLVTASRSIAHAAEQRGGDDAAAAAAEAEALRALAWELSV